MTLIETYRSFIDFFPSYIGTSLNLLIIVLVVVLYSVFIWKFQKFISKKNLINLDLNKYNKTQNPLSTKLRAGALYFLEYVLVIPVIIFLIYILFAFSLVIFIDYLDISTILTISAVVIVAVRILAYYNQELAEEVGSSLPLTLLVVVLLEPYSVSEAPFFEKILENISSIPSAFGEISYYLFFIIIIELVLRFFDFIISLFGLEEIEHEE